MNLQSPSNRVGRNPFQAKAKVGKPLIVQKKTIKRDSIEKPQPTNKTIEFLLDCVVTVAEKAYFARAVGHYLIYGSIPKHV